VVVRSRLRENVVIMWQSIILHLDEDVTDVLNLAQCNKFLAALCSKDSTWKALVSAHMPNDAQYIPLWFVHAEHPWYMNNMKIDNPVWKRYYIWLRNLYVKHVRNHINTRVKENHAAIPILFSFNICVKLASSRDFWELTNSLERPTQWLYKTYKLGTYKYLIVYKDYEYISTYNDVLFKCIYDEKTRNDVWQMLQKSAGTMRMWFPHLLRDTCASTRFLALFTQCKLIERCKHGKIKLI